MTNYVIINGVNSNTINGLGINELPPITKPLQRSLIEEIDGRDGDIITKLGYGAYDKTMTIGLFHTYDIDEVIAFFNGEGTITFSNEPDKAYYFTILDQIDYEKLINFKTATITLHCQPFKYPIEETPIEVAYQYVEGTGETLTLENTAEAQMTLDLLGNTQQDSTSISGGDEYDSPSPDYPQDIHTCSGDNTIKVEGKNLFDVENLSSQYAYVSSTGEIVNSTQNRLYDFINAKPNTQYTLSTKDTNYGLTIVEYDTSKTFIKRTTANNVSSNTITTSATTEYVRLFFNQNNSSTVTTDYVISQEPQLELGSTATPYEPYTSQSHLISLGTMELCKIGTYQDKIYKDNGKWYLHKEIGKVVLDGDTNKVTLYGNYGDDNKPLFYMNKSDMVIPSAYTETILMSDNYTQYIGSTPQPMANNQIRGATSTGRIYLRDDRFTTASDFNTQLQNSNVLINYVLATPTNTEITDTTLLEQLENIYSMTGITNITQENNDLPFTIKAKALIQGSNTATINNVGNIYSKPTLDIVGNGVVNMSLNGSQIFSVNVTDEIVIDSTNLEAYNPTTHELMNRQVTGNIANLKLDPGANTLTISGDLDIATITNYVRWL